MRHGLLDRGGELPETVEEVEKCCLGLFELVLTALALNEGEDDLEHILDFCENDTDLDACAKEGLMLWFIYELIVI